MESYDATSHRTGMRSPLGGQRTHAPHRTVRLAVVALLGLAVACEPLVVVQRDSGPPIPADARWAWSTRDADGLAREAGDVEPTPAVAQLLTDAITTALEARGFRATTADSAEFFVHFHLGLRVVTDTLLPRESPDRGLGGADGSSWGVYGRPEEMRDRTVTWREGMLIIDAVRVANGSVAWRGLIADEVLPEVADDPSAALRKAVQRLFSDFP